MTPEQKHRIAHEISNWRNARNDHSAQLTGDRMADLLQELIEAPESEPVARVTGYYAGYLSIATVDGRVLPTGTALYTAPPAPSAPEGWKHDCAGILQNDVELWLDNCPHCGKPKPDAAPTPAEAPADVARDAERYRWLLDSNWYVGPDSFYCTGGGELEDYQNKNNSAESLDAAVDAAIAAKKGGAK